MQAILEKIRENAKWKIERYADEKAFLKGIPTPVLDAFGELLPAISEFKGNLLLNEGIDEIEKLICSTGATQYNNANAYLGVGDDDTVADATQTGLQAAENAGTHKVWVGMDAEKPTLGSQIMTFVATFGSAVGNFAWREFTVVNAANDDGKNLNRKVSDQGTKASGQTWVLTLTITLS